MSATAAHLETVSVTATDIAATEADKIDGLSDATLSRSSDIVERNYLGGGGYKKRVQTLKDISCSLSGHFLRADAPQEVLRDAHESGDTVYVTFIFDEAAVAGSKGIRVPMLVESYERKTTAGGVVEFSCSLQGDGAPVAV